MGNTKLKLLSNTDNIESNKSATTSQNGGSSMTDIEKRLTRLEVDNEYIKQHLGEIKDELKAIQQAQTDLRIELKTDISNLKTEFQKDIHSQTKWIIATAIALVSLSFAAVKFLFS